MPNKNIEEYIIESFIEEFPIYTEEGPLEDSVQISLFINNVIKKTINISKEIITEDYLLGFIKCTLRFLKFLGLIDINAYYDNKLIATSYIAYNAIISSLELLKKEVTGFEYSIGRPDDTEKLIEYLKNIEKVREQLLTNNNTEHIRNICKVVGIAKGWSEELQKDVYLFYKTETHFSNNDNRTIWSLPGGSIRFSSIDLNLTPREKYRLRLNPTEDILSHSLINHISDKIKINKDIYELSKLFDLKNPLIKTLPSYTYIVITMHKFFPYAISFKNPPEFSIKILNNIKWFSMETIKKGYDNNDVPIRNEIILEVLNKINKNSKKLGNNYWTNKLHVPFEYVESTDYDDSDSITGGNYVKRRKQRLNVEILGRIIDLKINTENDLILFESNNDPVTLGKNQLSEDEIESYRKKYDIFVYDPRGIILSKKTNKKRPKIRLRGGQTERYYTLQLILIKKGSALTHHDITRLAIKRLAPQKIVSDEEETKCILRIMSSLRNIFVEHFTKKTIEDFINTRSAAKTISIGSDLKTCIIVEARLLIFLAKLDKEA